MMLPWPPTHLLTPDLIGAGLLERVTRSRRRGQTRTSVFSVGSHHQRVSGNPGGTGSPCLEVCVCLCSNMQSPLLPQLLCPAFIQGSEASLPAS